MSVEPGQARDELAAETGAYLTLAAAQLSPQPRGCAPSAGSLGSGKSTLARALAPENGAAPGAVVLHSDVLRKELMVVAPLVQLPQSADRPESRNGSTPPCGIVPEPYCPPVTGS